MLPENWDSMSPDEKFEARLGAWRLSVSPT